MGIKYVSLAKSRAGSAETPKSAGEEPDQGPKTSATPAAKNTNGGKSASKTEED